MQLKKIDYKKLLITFFAHIFMGTLYGNTLALLLHEYGLNYRWLDISILLGVIALVTYVAYKEEIKRHYPFLKALGVNFLALVLFFLVAFSKVDLLFPLAFVLSLLSIKYRCKACVEYKRFKIG